MRVIRGAVVALGILGLFVPRAHATKDLETVVKEHLSSRGGYDRVVGLLRYEMQGTISKNGTRLPFHVWWKQPNKLRIDVGSGANKISSVFDGSRSWTSEPGPWGTEPTGMIPGLKDVFMRQADWQGPFVHPERRGLRVQTDPVIWGDSIGYQVLVDRGTGTSDCILLSADTRMITSEKYCVGSPGFEMDFEQRYSRFRRTEGFAIAHQIDRYIDGELYDIIEVDQLIIGPPVDDSIFNAPAFSAVAAETPRLTDLNQVGQLHERFSSDDGAVRVLAILSPTAASSRKGFLDLQRMVDSAGPGRVSTYVVWSPILETDTRAAAAARTLECQNLDLVSYWDGNLVAAKEWRQILQQKRNAWDVCLIYGPESRWDTLPPMPDLAMAQNMASGPGYDMNLAQGVVKIRELLAEKPTDSKKRRASASDQ